MAILAGDALQSEAFRIIATAPGVSDRQRAEAVAVLAKACGADGMVAGQVLDILGLGRSRGELELLHGLKSRGHDPGSRRAWLRGRGSGGPSAGEGSGLRTPHRFGFPDPG